MKKLYLIIAIVFLSTVMFGQLGKKRPAVEEKIKSMQIAFITERLNLTPTESEKFWPIFNQMEAEKSTLSSEKNNEIDDKESQLIINRHFEMKEKEIAIEKKYVEKLKTAIPLSKIAKLLTVQRQFRQEIMANIINKAKARRGIE
jgi:hypothetical protein